MRSPRVSYAVLLAGASVLMVTITAVTTWWMASGRVAEVLQPSTLELLRRDTHALARRLTDHARSATEDVRALAGMDACRVLATTRSPVAATNLADAMLALLREKPAYLQLRMIAADDEGMELVRADRSGEGGSARVLPDDELQPKGSRSYVRRARELGEREVLVTEIELNRERGEIEIPPVSVLRIAVRRGSVIVVANLDVRPPIAAIRDSARPDADVYLFQESGTLLIHPERRHELTGSIADPSRASDVVPELLRETASVFEYRDRLAAQTTVRPAGGPALTLIQAVPPTQMNELGSATRASTLRATALAAVVALLVSLALVVVLMRPIRALTHSAEQIGAGVAVEVPTSAIREVDTLARTIASMANDIRRREQELLEKQDALARSNRDLEQYAYVASHDLKEPLRTVVSFSELLAESHDERLDARGKRALGYIVSGARRMQELVEALLAFARVDRASATTATSPADVVHAVLDELADGIGEANATVDVGWLPDVVMADRAQLASVVRNLLTNALKYRDEARAPEIEISADEGDDEWVFRVRDNGVGFDPRLAAKVFEMFARAHRRDEFPGTGIGLSLCRRIIERHGGRISAESERGMGTTITFTLPKKDLE